MPNGALRARKSGTNPNVAKEDRVGGERGPKGFGNVLTAEMTPMKGLSGVRHARKLEILSLAKRLRNAGNSGTRRRLPPKTARHRRKYIMTDIAIEIERSATREWRLGLRTIGNDGKQLKKFTMKITKTR
jgi:hypothetical protein